MALFRRGKKATTPGLVTLTPQLVEMVRAFDGSFGSFGAVYRKLAPVRTVVDFLADAVSTTSLKVHQRTAGGRPEARNHPLAVLLRNPNPDISSRSLINQLVHDLGIYGNAYWRKVIGANGGRFLLPLPPDRVFPIGGSITTSATQFDYWPGASEPVHIPRDEMVHFKLYNPEDRRIGSSKLEALRTILAEEIEVSKHRQGFWRNAARQDLIITRPADADKWSDDARERFRADWEAKFSGSQNAGKTVVLEDGMTPEAIAFSAKDSEFIEGRKFILEAVARVYNVPVSLLGLTQTATFASQKEFHKALYQDTLPPWYQTIESEIELQLLPWFGEEPGGDTFVEFAVESKLRGDFADQADIISKAIGRPWMEVAEGRKFFNFDDRGDPSDHELAVPNTVSLGDVQPTPSPSPSSEITVSKDSLRAFFDRQERAVLSKVGGGGVFDRVRWERELARLIPSNKATEVIDLTARMLAKAEGKEDMRGVFDALRSLLEGAPELEAVS